MSDRTEQDTIEQLESQKSWLRAQRDVAEGKLRDALARIGETEALASYVLAKTDEDIALMSAANARIGEMESLVSELREALGGMVAMYTRLVDSGDAGYWNVMDVPEVVAALKAIDATHEPP